MLYIVATPIGNLEDITLRALRILKEADLILTEDTRRTGILFKNFNIPKKPFLSFYEQNEEQRIPQALEHLRQDKTVALISRAGMPLVSDPGYKLVRHCLKEKISVSALAGASAVTNALVLSGLPTDSFAFLGFLPRSGAKQRKKLEGIKNFPGSLIIFENPLRLKKTLLVLKEILGERPCAILREMTKIHEEALRGSISEVMEAISSRRLKGECSLVLAGLSREKSR